MYYIGYSWTVFTTEIQKHRKISAINFKIAFQHTSTESANIKVLQISSIRNETYFSFIGRSRTSISSFKFQKTENR